MSESVSEARTRPAFPPLAVLADRTRRTALLVLRDSDRPLAVRELAARVTARLADGESDGVARGEVTSTHVELVHVHLPKLAESGLVERDEADGTVATTDRPALGDDRFERLVAVDADDWDEVLNALSSPRRRRAVAELAAAGRLEREALARRVAARERDRVPVAVPDEDRDGVLVSLHHVHLPVLEESGLVDYDGGAVRYEGHPDLDPASLTDEAGAVPEA